MCWGLWVSDVTAVGIFGIKLNCQAFRVACDEMMKFESFESSIIIIICHHVGAFKLHFKLMSFFTKTSLNCHRFDDSLTTLATFKVWELLTSLWGIWWASAAPTYKSFFLILITFSEAFRRNLAIDPAFQYPPSTVKVFERFYISRLKGNSTFPQPSSASSLSRVFHSLVFLWNLNELRKLCDAWDYLPKHLFLVGSWWREGEVGHKKRKYQLLLVASTLETKKVAEVGFEVSLSCVGGENLIFPTGLSRICLLPEPHLN